MRLAVISTITIMIVCYIGNRSISRHCWLAQGVRLHYLFRSSNPGELVGYRRSLFSRKIEYRRLKVTIGPLTGTVGCVDSFPSACAAVLPGMYHIIPCPRSPLSPTLCAVSPCCCRQLATRIAMRMRDVLNRWRERRGNGADGDGVIFAADYREPRSVLSV